MNPRKKAGNPPGVPAPVKPYYTNAVRVEAGPLLFIAGQAALDADGNLVGKGDPKKQIEQTLENIKKILEYHGATMDDIVEVTVYVTDMGHFQEMAPVRSKYFPANGPSSVILQVGQLVSPDWLVEISAIAVVQ